MSRGKSTRLPSAAPVFEYKGELYEGRPRCDGGDEINERRITLVRSHGSGERSVGVVASKQGDVITVHEIVELGEGVERLTIEIDPVQS